MLEPDFNPRLPLYRSGDAVICVPAGAPRCPVSRATKVLLKLDAAGRPIRQIELCDRHAETVIARERTCGLEILDQRDWR